ncbi:MAG: single-stranded-DNA-specific exonuclease RecJ [Caldilineaceae bacterium]|nr:single-stranded-DNA-specific exonuclease RecJ [Caldilineaceae bacterium]
MSATDKHWIHYPPAPDSFLESNHVHPALLQVLYNRGLRDGDAVASFLQVEDAVQENPFRLTDMSAAVARIVRAIESREVICVYGDFDADGVTATVLMTTALQRAGALVGAYIPNRVDEGYGLNVEALKSIAGKGAQLLVTVDCGIRSVAEVAQAAELGMEVILTDHHTIGPDLPPALAVINPRRDGRAGTFQPLAGVGVAYRLAQGVLRVVSKQPWSRLSEDEAAAEEQSLLDLVAIGTVADLMPLQGENRSLVRRGLSELSQGKRVGLFALMEMASVPPGGIDSTAISFRIAPRINAAGRLASAKMAYDLLRCQDYETAYEMATGLERLNQQRQALTAEAYAVAEREIAGLDPSTAPILIVASEEFQPGIVGLAAGKLSDQFYRPAIVIEQGEEICRGSARSIAEFNIIAALDRVGSLLVRHGGHSRAAGFTVRTEQLPALQDALEEMAAQELDSLQDLRPSLYIDTELTVDQIDWALQGQLARMEPVGQQNEPGLFLCRRCRVRSARTVGGGKHLKIAIDGHDLSQVLDGIGFGLGGQAANLRIGTLIDIVFHLEVNEWQGRRALQLNVQDLRSSAN